jgi:hypothetical protein
MFGHPWGVLISVGHVLVKKVIHDAWGHPDKKVSQCIHDVHIPGAMPTQPGVGSYAG